MSAAGSVIGRLAASPALASFSPLVAGTGTGSRSALGITVRGLWRDGSRIQLASHRAPESVYFAPASDRSGACVAWPSGKSRCLWQARQP